MDAKQIQQLRPRLNGYLKQFDDCFARCEPVAHLETYVLGQLSELPRKSIEPMADAAGQEPGPCSSSLRCTNGTTRECETSFSNGWPGNIGTRVRSA